LFFLFLECEDVTSSFQTSVKRIQKEGFINYFGEQRFGHNLSSAMIGKAILLGNFMEAVKLMFSPLETEESTPNPVEEAKKTFFFTQDIKKTQALMPHHKVRECLVLRTLNRYDYNEEGCVRAFLSLPYSARIFYLHSYCSYVWNQAVSKRIEKLGYDVVPGDLVLENDEPRVLSNEDIASGARTFKDIIFPLPGTSIIFPENETKEIYKNILQQDGIAIEDFRVRKLNISNIAGTYRNAIGSAIDLTYQLKKEDTVSELYDLHLDFILRPSCYATMFIRELMRLESVLS